jgi:hypothetical protein
MASIEAGSPRGANDPLSVVADKNDTDVMSFSYRKGGDYFWRFSGTFAFDKTRLFECRKNIQV